MRVPARALLLPVALGCAVGCLGGCLVSIDESLWKASADARSEGAPVPVADLGASDGSPSPPDAAVPPADTSPDTVPDLAATDLAAADGSGLDVLGPDASGLPPEADADLPDGGQDNCTAAGVPSTCDPLAQSGCAAGDCYLTPTGTRCVCPAGGAGVGDACNATLDCAPGLVCAGAQAPGICRPLCLPAAPSCPKDWQCVPITKAPQLGLCRPHG